MGASQRCEGWEWCQLIGNTFFNSQLRHQMSWCLASRTTRILGTMCS